MASSSAKKENKKKSKCRRPSIQIEPKCDKCKVVGKVRPFCTTCGGSRICKHKREKRRCRDCGGRGICHHGRDRHRCKNCNGNSMCEHGREKRLCRNCEGGGICMHGRRKTRCKECSLDKMAVIPPHVLPIPPPTHSQP